MEYTELTTDDEYMMVQSRLKQYEGRHFDATLNLAAAEATGKKREADQMSAQIADLETVIVLARDQLATMAAPAKREPAGRGPIIPPIPPDSR